MATSSGSGQTNRFSLLIGDRSDNGEMIAPVKLVSDLFNVFLINQELPVCFVLFSYTLPLLFCLQQAVPVSQPAILIL